MVTVKGKDASHNISHNISYKSAWIATALLCGAFALAAIDRLLPFLLIEPIKASFQVTDTEVALLTGLSFSLSMALFAVPLSWLADRGNRARLITVCIAIWCLATIGCGFADSFWMLFLFRMGVGFGEAALQPAAYSLLADLFPQRMLSRGLGALAFSGLIGNFVALFGGGMLYEALQDGALVAEWGLASGEAWRAVLVLVGASGLLLAFVAIWILKDPRSTRSMEQVQGGSAVSFWSYVRSARFFYLPFVGGFTIYILYAAGAQAWTAPFFMRSYGWSVQQVGQAMGTAGIIAGLIGVPFGVWLHRMICKQQGQEVPMATVVTLIALILPFAVLVPLSPYASLALVGFGVISFFTVAGTVIIPIVLTSSAPSHLRARTIAAANLVYSLLGVSLGPVVYGAFTDSVLGDAALLNVTMSVLAAALLGLCIYPLILATRRYAAVTHLASRNAAPGGEEGGGQGS